MIRSLLGPLTILALLCLPSAGMAQTAQEILARSIQAHGGDKLTAWKTVVTEGTIVLVDGVPYRAAYRLWAKLPGRLRVEHDLTADRGRRFDQFFLNGGATWMRRNLIVGSVPAARMQRWLDQCYGVAAYSKYWASFSRQPDAAVEWQVQAEPGSTVLKVVESRPALVIRATIDGAVVDLYIDRDTGYLLQEAWPDGRRVYSGFTNVGGRIVAMKINEFARGRQAETMTPITLKSVKFDVPVEDWLFEEDKPVK